MELSYVRPFLQSLCCNSQWNYAVFWKFKSQYEMMLVWEDGFCDVSKPRLPTGDPIEGCGLENLIKVESHIGLPVLDGLDGASTEYPIELAVTEMSSASHLAGQGVVGKAWLEGDAQWIYPDNMTTDTLLDSESPDEWLVQFAAGIKTILLLPVIPNGVLQLGSLEMVPENPSFVAYAIDNFEAHQKSAGRDPLYSIQHFNLGSALTENKDEALTRDSEKFNELQKGTNSVSTNDCTMPLFPVDDLYNLSEREFTNTPENVIDSWHPSVTFHAADLCQLSCENDFTVSQNTIPKYLHLDENEQPFLYSSNCAVYGDFMNDLMGFSSEGSVFEHISVVNDFNSAICDESSFASFVTESDLQKALESAGVGDPSHYVYDSSITNQNTDCNLQYDNDLFYGEDISGFESAGFLFGEDEMNHLLEAVVSNSLRSSFNDNNSEHSSLTTINRSSKVHLASSKITSQPKCSVTSAFVVPERKNVPTLSAQISSLESKLNTNRQQKRKRKDPMNPDNVSKLSKTSKRRVSNGDNQRTKPRDRQMIQDRLKELRDLIPNSEKCSIDGLLDKTIKHMDFLRSATDQADKLRLENLKENRVLNTCTFRQYRSSKVHLASSKITSQPKCSVTSAFVVPERKNVPTLSAQISSLESKLNTNRQQKRKRKDPMNPDNVSKLSKTSKRRVSNGDNQRTKPRDRQMIQDRLKELRDLIPNSEKCSIDGLLDKTIKHMDFLRSATDQADKLRLENLKEETDENIPKKADTSTCVDQKGTSWAVELGADQQSCPIIVKDLDHPGHMLIEMLCADHDRFLEISDVIHRLQLTILKGLMEEKPGKSWARFIVQASGNFHRLDIFWPLMQLMK